MRRVMMPMGACRSLQCPILRRQGGITSGGGFAPQRAQPAWQSASIAAYLTKVNLLETAGYAVPGNNATALGAGFPDLAAFAGNIMLVAGGIVMAEGGTSAASPFTAGMVSLLNSELQKQGAGPLGFLNTMLCKDLDTPSASTRRPPRSCIPAVTLAPAPAHPPWHHS